MDYRNLITPKMRAVSNLLIDKFVGMDYCISDTQRNLIIEVPRDMCNAVREVLKQRFQDVALLRNAYLMIDDLHDFILVKPLISESPIYEDGGVLVPNLEKMLVDHSSDKEYASFDDLEIQKENMMAHITMLVLLLLTRLHKNLGLKSTKRNAKL